MNKLTIDFMEIRGVRVADIPRLVGLSRQCVHEKIRNYGLKRFYTSPCYSYITLKDFEMYFVNYDYTRKKRGPKGPFGPRRETITIDMRS
jgi:serine kinase of HPr protein (carbohydrate metabolism regulator)